MRAPNYRWICHKCGKPNEPHTVQCEHCTFPAEASVLDINPEPNVGKNKNRSEVAENIFIFFPEALIGGFFALVTPLWAVKLLVNGRFTAAFAIVGITLACGYGFIWALRKRQKSVAYAILLLFIGLVFVFSSEVR